MLPVLELITCSEKLLNVCQAGNIERGEKIELIEQLLNEREVIIDKLKNELTITLTAHPQAAYITELEEKIAAELNNLYTVIKSDIKEINQKKRSQQPYLNPFNQNFDGSFYDKRK